MPIPITRGLNSTTGSAGKESGATKGAAIGAGLGGVIGSVVPGVGTIAGATAGATLGGIAGGVIQPGGAGTQGTQEYVSQVPVQQLSQGSQQILDGIRSLNNMPEARSKYLQPMTEAYLKTQMELKRRG